ncbi:hypothetical protein Tco_0556645 [Tanacetum coccineum]
MMEQPVLSLIEESLLVVFVELMGFDRNVEELMMVSDLLEPSIVVDEEVLDKTVIVLENCKFVERKQVHNHSKDTKDLFIPVEKKSDAEKMKDGSLKVVEAGIKVEFSEEE